MKEVINDLIGKPIENKGCGKTLFRSVGENIVKCGKIYYNKIQLCENCKVGLKEPQNHSQKEKGDKGKANSQTLVSGSLSDKIFLEKEWIGQGGGIAIEDVKEFIKQLKYPKPDMDLTLKNLHKWIDKLAGEELC